ncbi:HyaD/HybD family hydrogenase maturation endopeptidase [uncultured Selenomonas sp.]|uniref:HyaD/HybD family hydrogenase maturation endopeptidase n=1 Tax=uncultured Selenomonas sp. TaxID=159275 RepID=UPI0025EDF208|nr:HyaD/HybD family hydrogenase maturation endopeptidase [uncultured Selenomonas sp.]
MDDVLFQSDVTILGIGNVILRDEGFGVRVAEYLDAHYDFPENVQIVDGGTLGIELTQFVTGTKKLLVIDSINGHVAPGTRFAIRDDDVLAHFQDKISAHEVGIQDVLALLEVTGHKIPTVTVLGAQPYNLEAGVELSEEMKKLVPEVALSEEMKKLVPEVAEEALAELKTWGVEATEKEHATPMNMERVAEAVANSKPLP